MQIAYIAVYLVFAFFAARWNRGVLPVAAVLAVLLAIFALVAGPGWFARDKAGFAEPTLNAGLLGLLTLLIVPVQLLLVTFAHARLLAGLEHRARAPRPRGRVPTATRERGRTPPERPGYPRLLDARCGGGGTVDAGPSKGPVRKGVWVRVPPAASSSPRTARQACPACGASACRHGRRTAGRGRQPGAATISSRLSASAGRATRIPHGSCSCTGSSSTRRPARSQISAPAAMSHCLTVRSK